MKTFREGAVTFPEGQARPTDDVLTRVILDDQLLVDGLLNVLPLGLAENPSLGTLTR